MPNDGPCTTFRHQQRFVKGLQCIFRITPFQKKQRWGCVIQYFPISLIKKISLITLRPPPPPGCGKSVSVTLFGGGGGLPGSCPIPGDSIGQRQLDEMVAEEKSTDSCCHGRAEEVLCATRVTTSMYIYVELYLYVNTRPCVAPANSE